MSHGGDIYSNKVNIDFSVNVNPLGAPDAVKDSVSKISEELERYPDYNYTVLRETIAKYHNIKSDNILCGNGASEIFMSVAHALRPKKVLIPIPSFYGYQWAFSAVSSEIIYYHMKEDNNYVLDDGILDFINKTQDIDIIVLANPNNPVGNLIDDNLLSKLISECDKRHIKILLDECFMELSDNAFASYIDRLDRWDNLLVVRAFTKTFAIPALRLGYMMCSNEKILNSIRRQLPEWNVSLAAERAGLAALQDISYLKRTNSLIEIERNYMSGQLEGLGFKVYPSVTNFIMFFTDKPLYDLLLKEGILIRDCSDFKGLSKGYYRIAVRTHEDNEFLMEKIKDTVNKSKIMQD